MIAVFSGTSDGRQVVESLLDKGYEVACFNATPYGGSLYDNHDSLTVFNHMMAYEELKIRLHQLKVKKVIDCTHPFAQEISKNLMMIADEKALDYYRYERPSEEIEGYDSYEAILADLKKTSGPIFLTTGSNNLHLFSDLQSRVFCRVLPTTKVIGKCHDLGYTAKQIIGMQGPFSKELNEAMFKSLKIKHLVTKASGSAGGLQEKIDAAHSLDIKVYILKRPGLDYGNKFDDLNDMLAIF